MAETNGVPVWSMSDRLRKAREEVGLTTKDFAAEILVSRSTVSNYESPQWNRGVSRIVLRAWALRTGVPLTWLKTGEITTDDVSQ